MSRVLLCLFAALAGSAFAARADSADDGRCREPINRNFPSASPGDVGLSAERLLRLNEFLEAGTYDVRGLLILRNCKLVFERYKEGVARDDNHTMYSVTKSISATLVGELLYRGTLTSIDATIADLVPKPRQLSQDDWAKAQRMTLKNVMQMSSGITYTHDPVNNPIYALDTDRLALALSPRLVAEPGTRFNYSDGDVSITGAVIAAAANQTLYSFAKEALFDPLQMYNHDWRYADRAGRYPGGWGLRLRPMDMLKIGQLYIQNGVWNGRRLFDAGFPDLAWTQGPSKRYALHWWIGGAAEARGTPYFLADGVKGQKIYVFPTLHLVAAVTASLPDAEDKTVNALVVGALTDAADHRTITGKSDAANALKERQRRGFMGETRVFQQEQDRPRAP